MKKMAQFLPCEIERMLIRASPNALKKIPETPGILLILSPTAAMMEQSSMQDTLLTIPCCNS